MKEFLSAKVSFEGLLVSLGALVSVFTVTAFLGGIGWPCEITSHFRVQYAAGLAVLAAFFCLRRKFRIGGIFVGFAAANFIVVAPCFLGANPRGDSGGLKLRVMSVNVRTENQRYDLVIASINKYRPGLLVLEEVNERWLNQLAGLREDFRHAIEQPRHDNFGIALFSRLPLNSNKIVYLGDTEAPSVTAQIDVGGRRLTVLGTHPQPPGNLENFRLRNEQLGEVAKFVRSQTNPVIVLGDLNATPWSYYFQRLVRESGLLDSSKGRGIHATWPAALFPLGIPIDHCLVSPEIGVVNRTTGNNVGSDHLPIVVDLDLPTSNSVEK